MNNPINKNCLVKLFNDEKVSIIEDPDNCTFWFRADDIATILDIKRIRSSIHDFNEDEKKPIKIKTNGGLQKVIFISSNGLYKLLLNSQKPNAKKFLKMSGELMDEEVEKLIRDQQEDQEENKLLNEGVCNQRQKMLLSQYGYCNKNIIYIIKIKDNDDGSYVIKLGQSIKGIKNRFQEHSVKYNHYGGPVLLDCFEVEKSHEFEQYMHSRLKKHAVKNLAGHEKEIELFLIGGDLTYKMVIDMINNNIHRYRDIEKEYLKIQIEHLKLEKKYNELLQSRKIEPVAGNIDISEEALACIKLENESLKQFFEEKIHVIEKLITELQTPKKITNNFNQPLGTLGQFVQKINPESMTLIRTYETVSDVVKEYGHALMKKPSLNKAIAENTIYRGFRWAFVARDQNPDVLANIEPTVDSRDQNLGYVAKLDIDKTTILKIYVDRKTAAKMNDCKSSSSLDLVVMNKRLYENHYYMLYQDCDENTRLDYENKNGAPLLYKTNGVGKFDMDGELVHEYTCKFHCTHGPDVSEKTLNKALETGLPYNNFTYRFIGEKLAVPSP
jgi:prophage antirepressor-like protein/predicted phosphodiesterase